MEEIRKGEVMEIIEIMTPAVTGVFAVLVAVIQKNNAQALKQNSDQIKQMAQNNREIGELRLKEEMADKAMTGKSRSLVRETAVAVQQGRSNGELTNAIKEFDSEEGNYKRVHDEVYAKMVNVYESQRKER
jgi:hypothetical protein